MAQTIENPARSALPARVTGSFDGCFRGQSQSWTHALATRSHGLRYLSGYLTIDTPPADTPAAQILTFAELSPVWLRTYDPLVPDTDADWQRVTLTDVELRVERHVLLREAAGVAEVRIFGTLSAVAVPLPTDNAAPALPHATRLTGPWQQQLEQAKRRGCATWLLDLGIPLLLWWLLGWFPALLWLGVRWGAWLLAHWPFAWPRPCSCRHRPWLWPLLVGLPLAGLFSLVWAWLTGECPQLLTLRVLLFAVPLLVAAWLSRRPPLPGQPDWARRSRQACLVLWTCAVPLLWWARSECREPWMNWLLAAWQDAHSRDADAAIVARTTPANGAVRRTSIDEALSDVWSGGKACGQTLHLSGDLLFDLDSDQLRRSAQPQLRKLATLLRRSPGAHVVLTGHADHAGDPDRNRELSERRARAIQRALVHTRAVKAAQVQAVGRGSQEPIVDEATDPSLARFNRRVEVLVTCPSQEEP